MIWSRRSVWGIHCDIVNPKMFERQAAKECLAKDNEDGFNIYIGGSCVDCNKTTNWTKIMTIDKASYNWSKSYCDLGEC